MDIDNRSKSNENVKKCVKCPSTANRRPRKRDKKIKGKHNKDSKL